MQNQEEARGEEMEHTGQIHQHVAGNEGKQEVKKENGNGEMEWKSA